MLAGTYDPQVLGSQDLRSVAPDPEAAKVWYQKAAQMARLTRSGGLVSWTTGLGNTDVQRRGYLCDICWEWHCSP